MKKMPPDVKRRLSLLKARAFKIPEIFLRTAISVHETWGSKQGTDRHVFHDLLAAVELIRDYRRTAVRYDENLTFRTDGDVSDPERILFVRIKFNRLLSKHFISPQLVQRLERHCVQRKVNNKSESMTASRRGFEVLLPQNSNGASTTILPQLSLTSAQRHRTVDFTS